MKCYVYALIVRGGTFLILQRPDNKKSQPLYWNLPGGKLEENESCLECVKREVLEETGLIFEPFIKISDKIDRVSEDKKVTVFLGFANDGTVHLDEEHVQSRWVVQGDLVNLKTMHYIVELFEGVR